MDYAGRASDRDNQFQSDASCKDAVRDRKPNPPSPTVVMGRVGDAAASLCGKAGVASRRR